MDAQSLDLVIKVIMLYDTYQPYSWTLFVLSGKTAKISLPYS